MSNYIHLFYDHYNNNYSIESLQSVKETIFNRASKRFKRPENAVIKQDIQDMVENTILKEFDQNLNWHFSEEELKLQNIPYWELTVGQLFGTIKNAQDRSETIKKVLTFIERSQEIISTAITRAEGKIPESVIDTMKSQKEKLVAIGKQFTPGMPEDEFKKIFFGALKGTITAAQGNVHEVAGVVAAIAARDCVNKNLIENNQNLKMIIEHTGGTFKEDSELGKLARDNNSVLGLLNNSKNDITIAIKDGQGKIQWSFGLSLKSTSSRNPSFVRIMEQNLTALLNKEQYDQNYYLNQAAALGKDSSNDEIIKMIADETQIQSTEKSLARQWKELVYSAIYNQIIDMFVGSGGLLNDAQYLVINSQVISMYDIFMKLQDYGKNKKDNLFYIPGIRISGASKENSRNSYIQRNIENFQRKNIDNDILNSDAEAKKRGEKTAEEVYKLLREIKISISLKYAELNF